MVINFASKKSHISYKWLLVLYLLLTAAGVNSGVSTDDLDEINAGRISVASSKSDSHHDAIIGGVTENIETSKPLGMQGVVTQAVSCLNASVSDFNRDTQQTTFICFYTITWLMCAFSLVVDRYLWPLSLTVKGHAQIDGVKYTSDHVPQNSSINPMNFYCIKKLITFFRACVTVMDHRRRHSV